MPTQIVDNISCTYTDHGIDYKTLYSGSTTDKLFVLSISEIQKYATYNPSCSGQWLGYLRAPFCYHRYSSGDHELLVPRLYCNAKFKYTYAHMSSNQMAPIQPAMWIRIKRSN